MDDFIKDLLASREKRYEEQIELIEKFKKPIISFMLNIPGLEKKNNRYIKFHKLGISIIEKELKGYILDKIYKAEDTGIYYLASVDKDALLLKNKMIEIENSEMGRLFDIDVFDENKEQITRRLLNKESRKCLMCDSIAKVCIREQKHSYEQLVENTNKIIDKYM